MAEWQLSTGEEIAASGLPVQAVGQLLNQLDARGPFLLTPLSGGRNNRVYEVSCGEQHWMLKWYFVHPADQRPRLATEFAFCDLCWQHGLRWTPQPLACVAVQQLASYSWVPGRKLAAGEVTIEHVAQAMAFLTDLNRLRGLPAAQALPAASEACFCWSDHLARVEYRIRRLEDAPRPVWDDGQQAERFIRQRLRPAWEQLRGALNAQMRSLAIDPERELAQEERCLSPSDFGFHNGLIDDAGHVCFLDFEYAGWDDPAKLIGDFFSQPAVPVPLASWDAVLADMSSWTQNPAAMRRRAELLLPLYRMKWACIALNEYLPLDRQRRTFSRSLKDDTTRRASHLQTQLRLAEAFLAQAGY